MAVEDGRVASPGTHLDLALFRWMFPRMGQRPIESTTGITSALPRNGKVDKRCSEYRHRESSVPKKVKIKNDKVASKWVKDTAKTPSSTSAHTHTNTPLYAPIPRTDINNSGDGKVSVWDSKTHSWLVGDMAPSRKHLQAFLASRPHCRLHKEVEPNRVTLRRQDESDVIFDTSIPEYWSTEVVDDHPESTVQDVRSAVPLLSVVAICSSSSSTAPLDNRMELTIPAAHASHVNSKHVEATAMMANPEVLSSVSLTVDKGRGRGRPRSTTYASTNIEPIRSKAVKSVSPCRGASDLSTAPPLVPSTFSTSKLSEAVPAARTGSSPSHGSDTNSLQPICAPLELSVMKAPSHSRCEDMANSACAGTEFSECDESNAETADRFPDQCPSALNIEIAAPEAAPYQSATPPLTCSPAKIPTHDSSFDMDCQTNSVRDVVSSEPIGLSLHGAPVFSIVFASVLSLRTKENLEEGEVEFTPDSPEDAVSDASTSADCTDTKPVSPIAGDIGIGTGAVVYSSCLGLSDDRNSGTFWKEGEEDGASTRGAADSMQWKEDFFCKDVREWRKSERRMSDVSVQDEALRGGNVILNRKDGDCHDRQLSGTSKTERVGCVGRSDGAFTDDGEEDVTFHAALSDHDQEEKQRDCNMDQAAYRSALEIVEGRRGDVRHFRRDAPCDGYAGYSYEEEDDRMDGPTSSDDASQLISTAITLPNPNTDSGLTVLCDC